MTETAASPLAPAAFGLTFDHLGLATRSPEKAIAFLEGLGHQPGVLTYDPLQRVNLIYCSSTAMPAVEVIVPVDDSGPLTAILADRDEAMYHTCYRSSDVDASVAAIKKAGHRIVQLTTAQPAVLFGGKRVSFYLVRGFGLIEILEG